MVHVAVLTYDLVICKDSNDCLGIYFGTSSDDPGLEILTDIIQFSDVFISGVFSPILGILI